MKAAFSFIILLINLIMKNIISAGEINFIEANFNYRNAKHASNLSLTFTLDNPIDKNAYFKLIIPLKLKSPVFSLIDFSLEKIISNVSSSLITNKSEIYINFKKTLFSNNTYQLVIYLDNQQEQKSGVLGTLEIYTLSSIDKEKSKGLVYNANPSFTTLALAPEPSDLISINFVIVNNLENYKRLNEIYEIEISLICSNKNNHEANFEINFLQKENEVGLAFVKYCSVLKSDSFDIQIDHSQKCHLFKNKILINYTGKKRNFIKNFYINKVKYANFYKEIFF